MTHDRIIFLDIDGVLNWASLRHRFGHDAIDPGCVNVLVNILKATKAKIVVHSTWRIGHVFLDSFTDSFSKFMAISGVSDANIKTVIGSIIDTTLDLPGGKGVEIREWIDSHDVKQFVVIDDDAITIDNFIKTSDKTGLTTSVANQIVGAFDGQN